MSESFFPYKNIINVTVIVNAILRYISMCKICAKTRT
jgi:hypothetical protein